jgi:DNA repair exonuclease SbcCD nuclease subunit
MNALIIGDVHGQISNLEDTGLLFDLIEAEAVKRQVSRIIFLGDLFHTHSIVRQEVAHFYQERFKRLLRLPIGILPKDIVVITGNHDGISPSDISKNSCQLILGHLVNVVTEPQVDVDFTYVPFMYDNDKFTDAVNTLWMKRGSDHKQGTDPLPETILLCHQTFKGAAYESGMPVPEGVDSNKILFKRIIAGHIHKAQSFNNKVYYLGTPRAVTAGEANDPKYIHHLTDNNCEAIPTGHLVKEYKILSFSEEEGIKDLSTLEFKTKDDVRVVVAGSEQFYESFLEANKSMIGKLKFIPKIKKELGKRISVDENEANLESALKKYVFEVADLDNNKRDKIWEIVQTAIQ